MRHIKRVTAIRRRSAVIARSVLKIYRQLYDISPLATSKKLTHLGCFANLDFVAELFDSAREALRGSLLIGACEIECSEIAIRHLIAQQIIGDGKD